MSALRSLYLLVNYSGYLTHNLMRSLRCLSRTIVVSVAEVTCIALGLEKLKRHIDVSARDGNLVPYVI